MLCTLLKYTCNFILLVLVGFKLYIKLRTKWSNSYTCLIGKTVIVTGANAGIGYFTALDFAKRGARVILACRNDSRAQEARKKIIAATGNANVVVKLVDHSLFQSVRDFCKDINENEEKLDILVNNAGVWRDIRISKNGLENTWQVNHLSPFLLTILLSRIGYFTALDFAKRGARVILACRNDSRAQEARKKIIAATGNSNVVVKLVDHSLFQSVRDFCKDINENEEKLDILVNNAGVWRDIRISKDGLENTWQVNHLSPFLLTILLSRKLKKSAPSRIVNVSSLAAKNSTLDIEKYTEWVYSTPYTSYSRSVYKCSKRANILFSRVLAERLSGTDVTVYTLHPGLVATEIFKGFPAVFKRPVLLLMNFFFKTPEEGAQTTIHCSVAKELENESGKLYDECQEIPLYGSCLDMELAERLWKKCEELVHLQEHEKME